MNWLALTWESTETTESQDSFTQCVMKKRKHRFEYLSKVFTVYFSMWNKYYNTQGYIYCTLYISLIAQQPTWTSTKCCKHDLHRIAEKGYMQKHSQRSDVISFVVRFIQSCGVEDHFFRKCERWVYIATVLDESTNQYITCYKQIQIQTWEEFIPVVCS